MPLKDELRLRVEQIASQSWGEIPNARVPPEPDALTFDNDGKRLSVCMMYADLHKSTEMVDAVLDYMAAEYYKSFLHCAGKLIKRNGGSIQAYDGDRVMGVFVGADKADQAVAAALELKFAVTSIINPIFSQQYGEHHRILEHTVGIDAGEVLVAKIGIRRDSDLVWVGSAANYAAKLNSFSGLDIEFSTRITDTVYQQLSEPLRLKFGQRIWDGPYANLEQHHHYRTSWWREFE
jgi:class 3 adenylate cyclase